MTDIVVHLIDIIVNVIDIVVDMTVIVVNLLDINVIDIIINVIDIVVHVIDIVVNMTAMVSTRPPLSSTWFTLSQMWLTLSRCTDIVSTWLTLSQYDRHYRPRDWYFLNMTGIIVNVTDIVVDMTDIIHLLHAGEGNMNKFPYFLNLHAINVLLYRMKPRKHIHVKSCWQANFKSIGTLSQTFKNHIRNKWCVPSASDVFLSMNVNSGAKTREASEGVDYDFNFTEYDVCLMWSRVLIFTHCPIKLIYLW